MAAFVATTDRAFGGVGQADILWRADARCGEAGAGGAPTVHMIGFEATLTDGISATMADARLMLRAYPTIERFVESHRANGPGCIVLNAPGGLIGMDTVTTLRGRANGLPVVVAADRADARTIVFVMKAGAADFIEKPFCDRDILVAVEAAIRADHDRLQALARHADLWRRFKTLTAREREVMALVTQGLLNKQAAGDLGLSEITVKAHRGAAMRKMAARTLATLVRMADQLAGMGGAETEIFRRPR